MWAFYLNLKTQTLYLMSKFAKSEKWDSSRIIIQYAPAEVQHGEETAEEYTKKVIVPEVSKAAIVEALVRKEYSVSDEIAILRQRDTKPDEFAEYNNFAEACKAEANSIIGSLEG
jgi:hypothetical protein